MVCNRASWSNPIMVGEPMGSMMTALCNRHPGVMKMDLSCGRRDAATFPLGPPETEVLYPARAPVPLSPPRESDEACIWRVDSENAFE